MTSEIRCYACFSVIIMFAFHYLGMLANIGICQYVGIDSAALSQLMSIISITKFLSLRETSLTDGALCKFVGSSLEYLDVSETVV